MEFSVNSKMDEKMKLIALRKFRDFIESEKGKELLKQKNSKGGKLRSYKKRYYEDELTPKAALLILLDFDLIKDIIFEDFE